MGQRLFALEGVAVLLITLPLALWQSAFWVLVPLALLVATRRSFDDYGLRFGRGSVGFHLATSVVVLGGYAVGHYVFGRYIQGATFHPRMPPLLPAIIFHQLADVALAEEFFFRGYLQTNLNRAWGRPFHFLGARWGWGLPVASLLFAACHLVYGDVTQLKVFFFGLLAGWLRERTGGIAAPILYHAAGNILLEFMLLGFR